MCGIVGIVSVARQGLAERDCDMFRDLLIADSLRGSHGTGIVKVNKKGDVDYLKKVGNPFDLFHAKNYGNFHEKGDKKAIVRALIGHNRFATTGDLNNACAHPFQHGDITMVHNGTLTQGCPLPKIKDFKVDSEALCHAIDSIGLDEALHKTWGAYALALYNQKTKTLSLVRNSQRPLYFCAFWGQNDFAFASEAGMLRWVLNRNNYGIAAGLDIREVPIHTEISFNLQTGELGEREIRPQYPVYEFRPTLPAPYVPPIGEDKTSPLGFKLRSVGGKNETPAEVRKENEQIAGNHSRYMKCSNFQTYRVEDEVAFYLKSTKVMGDDITDPRWLMIGARSDMPNTELRYICRTLENKEQIEESGLCLATIKHIQFDTQPAPKNHVIYVANCKPIYSPHETKDIVGRSVMRDLFDLFQKSTKVEGAKLS